MQTKKTRKPYVPYVPYVGKVRVTTDELMDAIFSGAEVPALVKKLRKLHRFD